MCDYSGLWAVATTGPLKSSPDSLHFLYISYSWIVFILLPYTNPKQSTLSPCAIPESTRVKRKDCLHSSIKVVGRATQKGSPLTDRPKWQQVCKQQVPVGPNPSFVPSLFTPLQHDPESTLVVRRRPWTELGIVIVKRTTTSWFFQRIIWFFTLNLVIVPHSS